MKRNKAKPKAEQPPRRALTPDDIIDRENRIAEILADILREKRAKA